ncbi:MAG: asparagine synthase (glutamine-hydrolyzing) [Candidatus Competibacterales bacterium]
MCGIVALWGERNLPLVREMTQRLAHRGPDGQACHLHPHQPTVLGHTRLAIIDPEGGDQPLVAPAGDHSLVANGEIYNYRQLRNNFAREAFRTQSDSEVILHLFDRHRQDPAEAVARLDGMFAFVLQDGDEVLAARDPLGIKPLYLGRRGQGLAFASEVKALVGLAEDIQEFPPGAWFHSQRGFSRYYTLPQAGPATVGFEADVERWTGLLRSQLERSVAKWMISDVPVGAFLSGGLDSSIIAALAKRHTDELHTFAVGAVGSSDLLAARRVAHHLQSRHHEYVFDADDVVAALPEVLYYLESDDVDLVSSALPCYFVSRLACQQVKVALTGEGADELFAGYAYYRQYRDPTSLGRELSRSLTTMHNINLQRVDRITMAHGLEGRVPFLDGDLIALAQAMPADLKLYRNGAGQAVEKWILRKAVEDLLPAEIVWRDKAQFDEGSGMLEVVAEALGRFGVDARDKAAVNALYRKLLAERYRDPAPILATRGVWTSNRVAA